MRGFIIKEKKDTYKRDPLLWSQLWSGKAVSLEQLITSAFVEIK